MKEKEEKNQKNNPFPIKEMKEKIIKIKYNESSEALNGVKPDNIFLLDEIDYDKKAVEDWANKMIQNSFTEELQERLDKEFLKHAIFGINPLTPEECFNKVDKSK